MRVINDYQCSDCLKVTEEYEDTETLTMICPCGGVKHKMLAQGAYFRINGARMDLMTEKWAKTREMRAKKQRQHSS